MSAQTSDVALPRGGVRWDFGKSGPAASGLAGLSNRCRIQDRPRLPRGGCRWRGDGRSAGRACPCCGPSECKYKLISSERSQLSPPRLCLIVLPDGALPATCLGKELGNADGGLWVIGDSCCLCAGANRLLI